MAHLHDTGEEFMQDLVVDSGESFSVGLYNNSTDSLGEGDDLTDITTEPDNANDYARQSVSAGNISVDVSGSDAKLDFPTVTFSVGSNSETVDYWFVVVNFQSDNEGDGSATDHLFLTGALSQSRDLSQIETLEVDNVGGTLS